VVSDLAQHTFGEQSQEKDSDELPFRRVRHLTGYWRPLLAVLVDGYLSGVGVFRDSSLFRFVLSARVHFLSIWCGGGGSRMWV
jgi:hypothetical protein